MAGIPTSNRAEIGPEVVKPVIEFAPGRAPASVRPDDV
jgi:hypothetical protein